MLAHHDRFHLRLILRDFLHRQTQLETRTHPRYVGHRASENLLGQFLATLGCRNRDDRIRMHVIHMLARKETVERRVNGGCPGIEIESGVGVHPHHVIFRLRLQALVFAGGVTRLKPDEFLLIKR